jgi:hypothetical protein
MKLFSWRGYGTTIRPSPPAGGRFVPPRPDIAWRVGVTGKRVLADTAIAPLNAAVTRVLTLLRDEVTRLAQTQEAASACNTAGPPTFRVLSPLAEGADRLVAEAALALGYRLEAPLPFAQADYEADFPAAVGTFRGLLGQAAHQLELDGGRGGDETASYEAVGRYVVRNADLLIAIWDGGPSAGRGGTGDVVRFALRAGVPVWWLAADGSGAPRLLRTPRDLRGPQAAPAGEAATRALRELLRRTVLPPPVPPQHAHGALGHGVNAVCRLFGYHPTPLRDYLREDGHAPAKLWLCYARFMDWIAPRLPDPGAAMLAPQGVIESYWHRLYTPADLLAQAYGDRYRSSYLLIFALAFVAVICAVFGLAFHAIAMPFTVLELLVLGAIGRLVIGNHLLRWHERWIAYRLLSELCRKQQALAPLGWSLPNWEVDRLAADDTLEQHEAALPPGTMLPHDTAFARDAWVAWYFTAARRAAPLPEGGFTDAVMRRARAVGESLLLEQGAYHESRRIRSTQAARRLGNLGDWFFILTLVAVAIKLALLREGGAYAGIAGVVCALLPAAAAGFVGIRAYAEFELLAHQSARMKAAMGAALADLDTLTLDRPLAAQELGAELYGVALSMLQDIAGWAQLFRMKKVEAG